MTGAGMSNFVTVFRAIDSHRIKRHRQPVSCTSCQRRKTKCDRGQPCAACEKRNEGKSCRFGQLGARETKQEMQEKLVRLEHLIMGLASHPASGPNSSSHSSSDDPVIGDGVDTRYHGATSWSAVVDDLHDVRAYLEAEDNPSSLDEGEAESKSNLLQQQQQQQHHMDDLVLGKTKPITLKDVRESLPSRSETDKLVATYFGAKFLVVPFIHSNHFRRRYDLYWNKPSGTNFLWLSIMFSILSCGAMVAKMKGTLSPSAADARAYMVKASECLTTGEYLSAKPYSVEALMMYAHSRNVQKQDSDPTIWSLYALGVRLAQRRGYHLDASNAVPRISAFEEEMRRRTWFMVQTSDLLFSFQLGMPPIINDDVNSVDHPRVLLDDDFDEHQAELPPSRPPTDPIPMLAWSTKSRLCRILRRVLSHALSTKRRPYAETMALNAELDHFYASVPPCMKIRTIQSTSFSDEGYTIMHRLILELMFRKTLCVLHRQYLSRDKDDARYDVSRDICRDAAMRILDLHLEFDMEIRPGGRMYEDRFMVSSLTLHDFLVAAMIICLDVSESTNIR